ncbi:hypothetical protein [Afipia sp. GAS231]|uniref:hypothetical protein n=1 Tax=Afipia sp. GAS231 TaxID=1882747 RepID=UPI00087BD56A|nr:hypothetical protein [Afipia sp. GAS231]SDN85614.1 hypothetical protein SAMN05444050_2593 [Afipia sp. GAS231]
MPLSPRLKPLGLALAILAGAIAAAHAEVITSEFEAGGAGVNAGIKARPVPIGHRRPHAGNVPRDSSQDAIIRTEEEFDRRFGMCRRC